MEFSDRNRLFRIIVNTNDQCCTVVREPGVYNVTSFVFDVRERYGVISHAHGPVPVSAPAIRPQQQAIKVDIIKYKIHLERVMIVITYTNREETTPITGQIMMTQQ